MARVMTFNRRDLKGRSFFVIDHSVGRAGRNRRDDTQLVQILINRVIDLREEYIRTQPHVPWTRMTGPHGQPIAKLVVDGICGIKTCEAILAFQRLRANMSKDGTISAITNPDHDFYVSGRYSMANSMYILAIYSQDWIKTSIFDIHVEPLRGNLLKSMLRQVAGSVPG